MKVQKFVIMYHYSDGTEFLSSSLYDTFASALDQLVYSATKQSDVLSDCDGVQIKRIEFEL